MRERLEEHFSTIFEPQLKTDVSQKILSESKKRLGDRYYMLGVFIEDMILIKLKDL